MEQILANNPLPPLTFAFIMGVPFMILYVLEIKIILCNFKKFNTPFFKLFIIRAIPALSDFYLSYILVRIAKLNLFIEVYQKFPNWLSAILYFLSYYSFHCENLANMFILINRFTSIAFPMSDDKIWKVLFPVSIILIFGVPICFTTRHFTDEYYIEQYGTSFSINVYQNKDFMNYGSYYAAINGTIFCIVCLILNTLTIIIYRKQNSKRNVTIEKSQKLQKQIETKLTIYSFITFAAQSLMVTVYLTANKSVTLFMAIFNQIQWLSDFSSIVMPSGLLLWASSSIRNLVLSSIFFRWLNNLKTTPTKIVTVTLSSQSIQKLG